MLRSMGLGLEMADCDILQWIHGGGVKQTGERKRESFRESQIGGIWSRNC